MGVITLMVLGFTGTQITRLQQSSIKDAFLSEYQTHYSKNLTSSRYSGKQYHKMQIIFSKGADILTFKHFEQNSKEAYMTQDFKENFQIISIFADPLSQGTALKSEEQLIVTLFPYEWFCRLGNEDTQDVSFVIEMKQKNYCFAINHQMCRLKEIDCKNHPERDTTNNPLLQN